MIKKIPVIASDFIGLCRFCGIALAIRWLIGIPLNVGSIVKRGDLQPADRALGDGPFKVKFANIGSHIWIKGPGAISGIREMYVRDTYLHNDVLRISDGDVVLDLGANMGNFTNYALAHGRNVKVVAVEPNETLNSAFRESVHLNDGFPSRVSLIRAFVGLMGEKQNLLKSDEGYRTAEYLSEDELIVKGKLEAIDFLKCDIEGGEFELLGKNSKLLAMTTSLAVEVHSFAGDVKPFLENIEANGLDILSIEWDPDGTCTALARRP